MAKYSLLLLLILGNEIVSLSVLTVYVFAGVFKLLAAAAKRC